MFTDAWQSLGNLPPGSLKEARQELHRAVQLPACVAQSLLPKRMDDSQMALTWKGGVLLGEPLADGLRVGLALADLSLEVRDGRGGLGGRLPLNGRTQEEALRWLKVRLGSTGVDTAALSPVMPYDMPDHLVAREAVYSAQSSASLEGLAAWFDVASDVLGELGSVRDGASSLRCWPHHFDLGIRVPLDPGAGSEDARSIGMGLSPGDGSYGEPYFYATPWPYPKGAEYPALPRGHWHTEHWTGAVLTATELIEAPGDERKAQTFDFLQAAMKACEALLS